MKTKGFGAYLREWRLSAGLNQTELAEAAGKVCTPQYISLLENEALRGEYTTRPSEEVVGAFANALGIPVDVMRKLAGYAARKTQTTEDDEMLTAMIAELDQQTRDDVRAIVQLLLRRRKSQGPTLSHSPQPPISTMTKTDLTTDDHAAHTRKFDAERTHEEPHVGEGDGKPPNEMPPSDPPRRRPSDFRLVGTAYPETEQAKVEGTPLKIRK